MSIELSLLWSPASDINRVRQRVATLVDGRVTDQNLIVTEAHSGRSAGRSELTAEVRMIDEEDLAYLSPVNYDFEPSMILTFFPSNLLEGSRFSAVHQTLTLALALVAVEFADQAWVEFNAGRLVMRYSHGRLELDEDWIWAEPAIWTRLPDPKFLTRIPPLLE